MNPSMRRHFPLPMTTLRRHPTRRPARATWLAFVLAAAVTASAQSPPTTPDLASKSLEELMAVEVASVVGAARHEQTVLDAPSSVTVVSARDIRLMGYRTLADVLRGVRGLYVSDDRNYTTVGIRGFSRPSDFNTRVLLLVDGHRLNENIYEGALLGTEFPLDLGVVDRVEIIRGPGAALYGTNAFFAVINVITKSSLSGSRGEVATDLGHHETFRGRATASGRAGQAAEWLVSVSRQQSDGTDHHFTTFVGEPQAAGLDADRASQAFATYRRGGLRFTGLLGSREKHLPTGSYGTTLNDPRTLTLDRRGFLEAQYQRRVGRESEVTVRGAYDHYAYRGTYVYDDGEVLNKDTSDGNWIVGDVLFSAQPSPRHRLTAGAEFRANLRQDQLNYDEVPYELYLDDRRSSRQGALFVQDEMTLSRRANLVVGLRYDRAGLTGRSVRPRAGLVLRPDAVTAVKLLYGSAFRAPNVYELFYDESTTHGNPDLRPESLNTLEAVVERYAGRVRMTATAYHTRTDRLISQTEAADGLLQFQNIGKATSTGVEVEAEWRAARGAFARASYAYQQSREQTTGTALSNSPRNLAAIAGAVPFWRDRASVAVESRFIGDRDTLWGGVAEAAWETDAHVIGRVGPYVELRGGVTNLFDVERDDPVGAEHISDVMPQEGRTWRLGATVRF